MRNHIHTDRIKDQRLLEIVSAEIARNKLRKMRFPVYAGLALTKADEAAGPAIRKYSPHHYVEFAIARTGCLGFVFQATALLQGGAQVVDISFKILIGLIFCSGRSEH